MKNAAALAVVVACVLGTPISFPSESEADGLPDVARPSFEVGKRTEARGLVFFLRTASAGVVAIGTAHAFDLGLLAQAERVVFERTDGGGPVASASRFAVTPGIPFHALGGSIDRDFLVFVPDPPGTAARIFDPDTGLPLTIGEDVVVLGADVANGGAPRSIPGRVASSSRVRIEIELLEQHELRDWGGAPILRNGSGRVIGFLQAERRRGGAATVVATPIGRLLDALDAPLEEGAGAPFASFADLAVLRTPSTRRADGDSEALLRQAPERPGVRLRIEYPPNGAVVEDSICGSFVAGSASSRHGELRRFDVIFVLDVSGSTYQSTGVDINGNGVVGKLLDSPAALFTAEQSDPGDSILAAEVAAARQLLMKLDPRSTRVGVVTFSSTAPARGFLTGLTQARRHAETRKPLTTSYEQIEKVLDELLESRPVGETHIAAGLDQATIELLGLKGSLSRPHPKSHKVVFFFTDGQPTLPYGPDQMSRNVAETFDAADRARRGKITVHTFAIGPDALEGPISTVEMAARTGGTFTPVRHPGELVHVVEAVEFPSLRDIEVRGAGGESPLYFHAADDGTFAALVKLAPGTNDVDILGLADDGTQTRVTLEMNVAEGARTASIPKRLAARRNQLLEECLEDVQEHRLAAEKEHSDSVRRELLLAIERERARARSRADEQRKDLELEVER